MKNNINAEENQQKYFAIVPHFALQPKTLENFYRFLQTTYAIQKDESLNIVIISPDHFDASDKNINMLCKDSKEFCYQNICIGAKTLPSTKTSGCLDPKITQEHGLGIQFSFIKKIFPRAKIFPIVVKPRKFIENTQLIKTINDYPFIGKTLILASVDFSHYTDEDFAELHDKKSFYTLNNASTRKEYESL
ncbi:MAG TPA: AmmeMemoRadiSam system protein B, partial [Candidatus Absconditabacterales bacterium]|nr:AmmeMemoRadiSam system protein B [Candidatus Absconditabacterales bacterium]